MDIPLAVKNKLTSILSGLCLWIRLLINLKRKKLPTFPELCEHLKGEGAGILCSHRLEVRRIGFPLTVNEIGDTAYDERLHTLIGMQGCQEAISFHLNCQCIAITLFDEIPQLRTGRCQHLFTGGNWTNQRLWCWIREGDQYPFQPVLPPGHSTRALVQSIGRIIDTRARFKASILDFPIFE